MFAEGAGCKNRYTQVSVMPIAHASAVYNAAVRFSTIANCVRALTYGQELCAELNLQLRVDRIRRCLDNVEVESLPVNEGILLKGAVYGQCLKHACTDGASYNPSYLFCIERSQH